MQILKGWSVCLEEGEVDPYIAPELIRPRLQGRVYNHSGRFQDGDFIVTTKVIDKTEDGGIITASGSVYYLQEPDPQYVDWCKEKGLHIPTDKEPIKWKD